MKHLLPQILISVAVAVATTLFASATSAQTYSNQSSISIPSLGTATPFPSVIFVSEAPVSISSMTVTLTGVSHTFAGDVAIMLVSPTGARTILSGRVGANATIANATLVFRDGAPPLPSNGSPIVSGEYSPTRAAGFSSIFAGPAPTTPTTSSLNTFTRTDSNGIWYLYVQDFASGDFGTIAGGWSISFTGPAALDSTFVFQGKLDSGAAPVNGTADFRFSLWSTAADGPLSVQVGDTIARNDVPVTNGLFTTSLDFGFGTVDNKKLFMQIDVRSPSDSGDFQTLSPRQPLTAAPNAQYARKAAFADSAGSMPWSNLSGQAQLETGSIVGGWQLLLNNTTTLFRGGLRLTDVGWMEMTNNAAVGVPNFARLGSNGVWTAVSDARLKTDITSAEGSLAAALKLRPVNFRWKTGGAEDFGLIAQDVRGVLPQLVTGDERTEMLTLNYSQLSVVAIGAIQELSTQTDRLKAENADLKAALAELRARLGKLEQRPSNTP